MKFEMRKEPRRGIEKLALGKAQGTGNEKAEALKGRKRVFLSP